MPRLLSLPMMHRWRQKSLAVAYSARWQSKFLSEDWRTSNLDIHILSYCWVQSLLGQPFHQVMLKTLGHFFLPFLSDVTTCLQLVALQLTSQTFPWCTLIIMLSAWPCDRLSFGLFLAKRGLVFWTVAVALWVLFTMITVSFSYYQCFVVGLFYLLCWSVSDCQVRVNQYLTELGVYFFRTNNDLHLATWSKLTVVEKLAIIDVC